MIPTPEAVQDGMNRLVGTNITLSPWAEGWLDGMQEQTIDQYTGDPTVDLHLDAALLRVVFLLGTLAGSNGWEVKE